MIDDEINNRFVNAYRSLESSLYGALKDAENNRRNAYTNIMGAANKSGMMYSNFPERSKIQYDTYTYLPAIEGAQNTYQTGLQKIRNSAIDLSNQLASINEAVSDLNEKNKNETWGQYKFNENSDKMGAWFYDNDGNPVRMSTYLLNNGLLTDNATILKYAQQLLSEDRYERLLKILSANPYKNLTYNAGPTYTDNNYDFLSQEDNQLLNELGLGF